MPINNSRQEILNKLANLDNDARTNVLMNETVKSTVKEILSKVENNDVKLTVNKIWLKQKNDNNDIAAQQRMRNNHQSWTDDVRADVSLIDKITGKVIDRNEDLKIVSVPKLTPRNTFNIAGNEYAFTKQSRLKPGVYTREQENGEISSFFNVDKTIDFDRGFNNNFKINFNPERKTFTMGYGSKNVPLYNALKAVGVKDSDMIKSWGKDVTEANRLAYEKHEVKDQNKLYDAIFGKEPATGTTHEQLKKEIKDRLFATKLSPETTKITLGKEYDAVNTDVLLDASKKIIDIHKGEVEGDDRESLLFKSFHDIEDHVRENLIKKSKNIIGMLSYKLGKTKSINKSISSSFFDPYVIGTITTNMLSNPPTQTNIMSMIGDGNKITVMGEGGIGTQNAVTNQVRQISNSEAGFIDPLHTPEGRNIGITSHLALNTIKIGSDLYSTFIKPKTGEVLHLKPSDTHDMNVAFPDQYDLSGKEPKLLVDKVKVLYKSKFKEVDPKDVDVVLQSHVNLFDHSANMIPFLDSLQGNRGLTASKMQEQALSLKHREKPLFNIVNEKGSSLGSALASTIALPKSPIAGEIVAISPNDITIKDDKENVVKVQLYNNFSLNTEGFLHNEPVVKIGDKIKKGQLLADNNNTRDGQIALGTNLKVAYLPYKGYNYEDSAIISETGAKKLTSEHIYDFSTKRSATGVFSKNKFRAYYPEVMTGKQAGKLDSDGAVHVGQIVDHGDVLIAHLERKAPTADDLALGRLDKQLRRDMANNAIVWDNNHKGVVTSVAKHGNTITVSVKTEEPLKIADKISGLHGNKHIISKIVPDHEMLFNPATGEHIDLTMSPIGVSNRINTSQLLEAAAGKIAQKTGKQYDINNFTPTDNTQRVLDDLKKNGLTDKEVLVDPETGKRFINPVMTGVSHILKLEHKVDHKFSARYRDGYDSNEQAVSGGETGGKNLGRMEVSALLARGANENLKEMYGYKGQKNNKYWKALESGESLPPPEPSFVWNKQLAMMKGAGINVVQEGKQLSLKPITDAEILELSNGKLTNPTDTYRKKDMAPIKGGLFDPIKAGGMQGKHYTHFELPEKILNPITASAAANLLDKSLDGLETIINGKSFVDKISGKEVKPGTPNAISGGPAVEMLLERIDVDKDFKNLSEQSEKLTNKTQLNKVHKKLRYLKALKEKNMKPTDYMIKNVLVVPSQYRPMFSMGTDQTVIMSDVNDLYQQTAYTSEALKGLKDELNTTIKDEDLKNLQLAESRGAIYQDVKALSGLREPTAYLHKIKDKKGFIMQIDGGKKQTKEGFFQDKVLERRQDLVGRSTIILNPELSGDEIGIPKLMANKIFQPKIMKKLVGWGYSPLEAQKQIEDDSKAFQRARQVVTDESMVIANRAPSLHRYNMMGHKPVLTDGKSIEVPSVVISKNQGGDIDGDCTLSSVFIGINFSKVLKSKKISFGINIDFDVENDYMNYIQSFLALREVNMPTLNRFAVKKNKYVFHIHLSEFPRIVESKVIHKNGNEDYDVPEGVSIFTIDNKTHEFVEVPVTKFSIHKNLINHTVDLSSGDTLWLSNDQSAIALNMSTYELERITPLEIKGRAIPKVRNMDIETKIYTIPVTDFSRADYAIKCNPTMPLNDKTGWLLGTLIGDGWVSIKGRNDICLANTSPNIAKDFDDIINSLLVSDIPLYSLKNTHDFDGHECHSEKHTKCSSSLTKNFIPLIGEGAHNKHLPAFYMSTSEKFRLGLLSGLLDTDGTVGWNKKPSGKFQFNMCYSTMSDRLAEEMVTLCRSLGIVASIGFGNNRPNGREKRVVISTNTAHGKKIILRHEQKSKSFKEFCDKPLLFSSVSARQDLIPFSDELFKIAKTFIEYKKISEYNAIQDSKEHGMVSRMAARKIIALDTNRILPQRWIDIVNNESVTWVYAKDVKLNPSRTTMYDITAPGPYTFMVNNGVIVQDTFMIHTPISLKAIEEAKGMMASNNMLKVGYDTVLNTPGQDMVVGSWLMSKGKGGIKTNLKYDTLDEARKEFKNHKFTYGDEVNIGGIKSTFGMHEVNSVVPEDLKNYSIELNSKNIDKWIKDITLKHNGKLGLALADKLKTIGSNYVTAYGYSLGLEDVKAMKDIRDPLLLKAEQESDKKNPISVIKAFSNAKNKMLDKMEKAMHDDHPLKISAVSGGGKGFGNSSQIIGMPGIVLDAEDNPIAMPVTQSYSEGLNTGNYWSAAHGARGGNIKKSVQSYRPGWMTKDIMNSIYDTRIFHDEPVDNEGLEYSVSNKKNIINRYLAKDVNDTNGKIVAKKNDLIDDQVINKLNKVKINHVYVQSPLTDPTPGDGISSYSYGIEHNGKRLKAGDNIGIISAHTVTEPSLNLMMKSFHTGGAMTGDVKKSKGTAFDVLDRLLKFTHKIPDKSTMSSLDGKVKSISKSSIGGYDVVLQHNNGAEEVRYVEPANTPTVKVGDIVKKGDLISTGNTSVHDVLKYKGMKDTQKFLVNELDSLNEGKLDRRNIEVIVRGITNTARVLHPGDSNYVIGDTAPLTTLEDYNKHLVTEKNVEEASGMKLNKSYNHFNAGTVVDQSVINNLSDNGVKRIEVEKKPIHFEPFLSPLGIGGKIAMASEDWISRLAHNRIEEVLQKGTAMGWSSDISGSPKSNPLPNLVAG